MNLPYDATRREIEDLVKEFAEIEDIAIPRDKYASYQKRMILGSEGHAGTHLCTSKRLKTSIRSLTSWMAGICARGRSA